MQECPRSETGLFIGTHIGQLALIAGLEYALWLLVEGIDAAPPRSRGC